jgi:hypothetical protein
MLGPGPGQVAEKVVRSLDAPGLPVASVPARVADAVLVALGSSAAEHPDLAGMLAAEFRADVTRAVEASVHRALLGIGCGAV